MLSTRQFFITWTIVFLPTWRLFGNRGMLHGVVSDIIMPFNFMLLENSLPSTCTYDDLLKLRSIYRTGNQIKHKPMPLHTFAHSDSHTLIRKFFLPIKRMGSIRKKWKFWDSNSGLPGYEPGVLTAELNFLSRSSLPDCRFWVDLLLLLQFFATSRNKGHGKIEYLVFTRIPIRDIWSPFNQLRWARWVSEGLCEINHCQVHAQPSKRG